MNVLLFSPLYDSSTVGGLGVLNDLGVGLRDLREGGFRSSWGFSCRQARDREMGP